MRLYSRVLRVANGAIDPMPGMPALAAAPAKNVGLMISDRANRATWNMAGYREHGASGRQP